MAKSIDFKKTIRELCQLDPEITAIMSELGFENITNPTMLNTVGRIMTIPKGAAMKGIDMEKIKATFIEKGYQIEEEGGQQ